MKLLDFSTNQNKFVRYSDNRLDYCPKNFIENKIVDIFDPKLSD